MGSRARGEYHSKSVIQVAPASVIQVAPAAKNAAPDNVHQLDKGIVAYARPHAFGALFARIDNCRAKVFFEAASGRLF